MPVEAHTIDLTDAQTRRQLKVQRYQKEKLIRAKLEQLAPSPWRASAVDDDNASTDESEDSEREVWLLKVELAVLEAAENMSHIKQVSPLWCLNLHASSNILLLHSMQALLL